MKKKYVHIKEYDLTKLILDYMDIDNEDDGKLYYGTMPLKHKKRFFTLVPYKQMRSFRSDEMTPIRPFVNVNHCQYLINLFSDINDCETLFEYGNMKDDESLMEGFMKITYKNNVEKIIKFYGTKNLNVLMAGVLAKMVLPPETFRKNIGNILRLDHKITESKNNV